MSTPPLPSSMSLPSSSAPSPSAAAASSPIPTPPPSATTATANNAHERHPSNPPSAKRVKTEHATAATAASTPRAVRTTATESGAASAAAASAASKPATTASSNAKIIVATSSAQGGGGGGAEARENFDSLVDIMGASGVDLRAEEEAIQQRDLLDHSTNNAAEAQKDQDGELYLQVYPLAFKVHTIAQKHGLGVDALVLNYLSLAARVRFRNMLEAMIASSRHRSWSSHQHAPPLYPTSKSSSSSTGAGVAMYHERILSDPRAQLAALEKAEKGDEARRRKERLARDEVATALSLTSGSDLVGVSMEGGMDVEGGGEIGLDTPRSSGAGGGDGKRKAKKIGPGVTARNMSEDVQKRLANSTAMRNLGGSSTKYSWLQGASSGFSSLSSVRGNALSTGKNAKSKEDENEDNDETGSRLPKPKFAPQPIDQGGMNRKNAPSSSTSSLLSTSTSTATARKEKIGAWGDVSARQAEKEKEEERQRLQVTLRDALFALEYERGAASGYGSGEMVLYRARAKAGGARAGETAALDKGT